MKDFINKMTKNTEIMFYKLLMSSLIPILSSVALSFGNSLHRFWRRWNTNA